MSGSRKRQLYGKSRTGRVGASGMGIRETAETIDRAALQQTPLASPGTLCVLGPRLDQCDFSLCSRGRFGFRLCVPHPIPAVITESMCCAQHLEGWSPPVRHPYPELKGHRQGHSSSVSSALRSLTFSRQRAGQAQSGILRC